MFFGRKKELEILDNFYTDESAKTACIFGRIGIGKTSLVKEFSSNKVSIYFNAYATTGIRETELFARAAETPKTKLSSALTPADQLSAILSDIADKADIAESPLVLIIDNYPYFARAEAGFDKLLFDFAQNTSNLKLVVTGDSYLAMSKIFLDKKSLWKNSLSVCFELKGLGFYESADFLSEIDNIEDKAMLYGICGGIPAQLNNASKDFNSSLDKIFFDNPENMLTPEKNLMMELRELSYYNHILTVLANGMNRVNQISENVSKPKDVVVPYMNTLMSIGVVTKENPITEKTNRKKTRYSIINTYDLFYYRFIVPYIDYYLNGQKEEVMELSIKPRISDFMDTVFVSMCREYLERKNSRGELPFVIDEIGNWWHNDDEKKTSFGFDLVAMGNLEGEDAMGFCRCYYTKETVDLATLKELIDLAKQVKGKKNVFYVVFSKNGFHENTTTVASSIKNIILVSLEDIVNG